MKKILIIEDDKKLRKELEIFLTKNGYEVEGIEEFEDVITILLEKKSDLVLLDINLPFVDGQYICKEVRKQSNIPIIMITSKNNEMDELLSMNYGADDFVTKPFNPQILLARISAILKRMQPENTLNEMSCGELKLNISKSRLEIKNKEIELTKNEMRMMTLLLQKKNQIVTREEMMTYLWDSEMFVDDNTLTVNMTRLRNKMEELGWQNRIETKRGQGYLLKEEKKNESE